MTVDGTTWVLIGNYYERKSTGIVRTYYYADGQRVALRENGTLYYLLSDHLGSTNVTTDSGGAWYAEERYKPWGQGSYSPGTTPTGFRFTGQWHENALALYDFHARWYDPALGRFIQADTM